MSAPPPPGPPPPPAPPPPAPPSGGGGSAAAAAAASSTSSSGGGLLASLATRSGGLKKTTTVDRSAPKRQGALVDKRKNVVTPQARNVPTESTIFRIDAVALYNMVQDSGITKSIFDVRARAAHDAGHAKTALPLAVSDDDAAALAAAADGAAATAALDALCAPRDADDAPLTTARKRLAMRGLTFQKGVVYDSTGGGDDGTAMALARALRHEGKLRAIYVLTQPFDAFASRFPFMLSSAAAKCAVKKEYPAQIDDWLFIGSYEHASNKQCLEHLRITHVVNMADELVNVFPDDYQYTNAHANDVSTHDLGVRIPQLLDWIVSAQQASTDHRVLVHCAMGISRASSMVVAYLMRERGMSFDAAVEFVRDRRSIIRPNPGFCEQLRKLEVQWRSAAGGGGGDDGAPQQ